MAIKYGKKKQSKQNNIVHTIITVILLSMVFFGMVSFLYNKAEEEAYEALHVSTKQVKDDLILQLLSDRENLSTMASFAAKLYKDGEDYSILFESFKPIGMIENIGILNTDNTFSTKAGTTDLNGALSFEEEKEKGVYISSKINDITKTDYKLIRSAVPITVSGETVGILYGAIKPDKLGARYEAIVSELDAQLFVYEKETGNLLIDTIQEDVENISFLKNRVYNPGYSYEQFVSTDKGFVSFESTLKNETLHLHYSTIDELGWMIAMGRYDSQVFANAHVRAMVFTIVYILMLAIIILYVLVLIMKEKRMNLITECASNVRKELLETIDGQNNIQDALSEICKFAKSRSAIFFNTDGEYYHYISPEYEEIMLSENESKIFRTELFRYVSIFHNNYSNKAVTLMCIKPDKHMKQNDSDFYEFLNEHKIYEISLSATVTQGNHITILATVNSKKGKDVRMLAEKVAACFSMALYNKNRLIKTENTAITDSLTGAFNRVAYKEDMSEYEREKPSDFSCVFIDVNELHMWNNKYGHTAGDEMLICVANSLKDSFSQQKVYRIGGDEFLVFLKNSNQEDVKECIEKFKELVTRKGYNVSVGLSFRTKNPDVDEMIKEAEIRMYEEKARYYQNKESQNLIKAENKDYIAVTTGIFEIDTMLSVLKEKYNGIYRVSLDTDKARRILMPAYLNYNENEEHFSSLFLKYIEETVDSDSHRAVTNFLNYNTLKRLLLEGTIPRIKYKKNTGENVILSVYKLCGNDENISDTLWVFAKE